MRINQGNLLTQLVKRDFNFKVPRSDNISKDILALIYMEEVYINNCRWKIKYFSI